MMKTKLTLVKGERTGLTIPPGPELDALRLKRSLAGKTSTGMRAALSAENRISSVAGGQARFLTFLQTRSMHVR
jgi:hypothetical protein